MKPATKYCCCREVEIVNPGSNFWRSRDMHSDKEFELLAIKIIIVCILVPSEQNSL